MHCDIWQVGSLVLFDVVVVVLIFIVFLAVLVFLVGRLAFAWSCVRVFFAVRMFEFVVSRGYVCVRGLFGTQPHLGNTLVRDRFSLFRGFSVFGMSAGGGGGGCGGLASLGGGGRSGRGGLDIFPKGNARAGDNCDNTTGPSSFKKGSLGAIAEGKRHVDKQISPRAAKLAPCLSEFRQERLDLTPSSKSSGPRASQLSNDSEVYSK